MPPSLRPDSALALVAFDYLATLVVLVDAHGLVQHVNAAMEQAAGLSRRALEGTVFEQWFTEPGAVREAMTTASTDEFAVLRFEAQLRRNLSLPAGGEGEAWQSVLAMATRIDEFEGLLVELMPLTQQNRSVREARALDQVQTNKELMRNLAHEIKNPLGGIRGAAQLLQHELPSRELHEYTRVIIHEADRLQSLVDRLLAPHRVPRLIGDVNIHEVCERVRSVILAEFPRGLTVARNYDVSLPEFRGDREQLIQAVLNIAHNAAQALTDRIATTGDACITLRTCVLRQVTLNRQRFRLALELHVEDNGPGIPESIRDRVFLPLVSGREGGSGLGLTLAQTFVQQHGGTLECDSVPGRTVFKLLIPLS